MTLPIERARTRTPVTWLTIIGVILLPVLVGGVLVAALYNPVERLDNMRAAIVNDDQAVEINGQLAPLGRQLTAGLVEGSDDVPSNLDWVISNDEDARTGLADGTYDAVITIPTGFSAAATSTAPGGTPEKATIRVETAPDSLVVDDAITAQITQAATSLMGSQLSTVYLENVFLGFTTLGDQLGDAASGAHQLADGGRQSADGATQLADGAGQLGTGAAALSDGVGQLAGGASQLADGAAAAQSGLTGWAGGARQLAAGTNAWADGLSSSLENVTVPEIPAEVVSGAQYLSENSGRISTGVTEAAQQLAAVAASCEADGGSAELCEALRTVSDRTQAAVPEVTQVIGQSGQIAGQIATLAETGPEMIAGLQQAAGAARAIAGNMDELAGGADALAAGGGQLADGARQLSTGAAAASGGADQLAAGATELSGGATTLATGLGTLADGTGTLADGLDTATAALPSYTDQQATDLASVVAAPVGAEGLGTQLFGASAVPLLTGLALWLGAIGSFIALQAVPRDALSSRRPSALLALRAFAPAAVVGFVQGVLVAVVVQLAASYDPATWVGFAALSALAGVAFAAVNQALVALLGGAGRWIAAGVAALAVATGVVSTVPGMLSQIASLMPTTSAYRGLLAVLTSTGGVGAAVAGLLVWAALSLAITVIVTARSRTTSVRALLRPAT